MFNSTNALVEKVERLEKDLRYAKLELDDTKARREEDNRRHKEDVYSTGRAHKATVDGLNDEIGVLEKLLEEAKADMKKLSAKHEKELDEIVAQCETKIELAEEEADARIEAAEDARDVEVSQRVQELRESFSLQSAEAIRDHALEVAKLSAKSNEALVRAALAEGKLESIVAANESLEAQLEAYKSLVETTMAYLPTVDLAKMHMNVNIPVTKGDVTVVK
jgi:chromosome segregation ATPase